MLHTSKKTDIFLLHIMLTVASVETGDKEIYETQIKESQKYLIPIQTK